MQFRLFFARAIVALKKEIVKGLDAYGLLAVWRKHLYPDAGSWRINIIGVAVYRKSVPTTSGNVAEELVGLGVDYA
jgi:hypothetical protein